MKGVTPGIIDEQVKDTNKPVAELYLEEFGFPAAQPLPRFGYFNWRKVHSWDGYVVWDGYYNNVLFRTVMAVNGCMNFFNLAGWICCNDTDDLVVTKADGTVVKIADPDFDTDFSSIETTWPDTPDSNTYEQYQAAVEKLKIYNPYNIPIPSYTEFQMEPLHAKQHASKETYFPWAFCTIADKNNNGGNHEVMQFRWEPDNFYQIQYKRSTDGGGTWGSWTNLAVYNTANLIAGEYGGYGHYPVWLRASYKPNGDICLIVILFSNLNGSMPVMGIVKRIGGTWGSFTYTRFTNTQFARTASHPGDAIQFPRISWLGFQNITSCEIEYTPSVDDPTKGDWLVIYTAAQGNISGVEYSWATSAKNYSMVIGDGGCMPVNYIYQSDNEVNIGDAYMNVRSMNDISPFRQDGNTTDELNGYFRVLGVAFPSTEMNASGQQTQGPRDTKKYGLDQSSLFNQLTANGGVTNVTGLNSEWIKTVVIDWWPISYLLKVPSGDLIWSCNSNHNSLFFTHRRDMNISDCVFGKAYQFEETYPMQLACSSKYIYALTSKGLFMSELPTDWTKPTAGTGAAGVTTKIERSRILRMTERVQGQGAGSVIIDLDNSDDYYDTPPAVLHNSTRINIYLGHVVGGAPTLQEYQRYFIQQHGDSGDPNKKIYRISAVNGEGLLARQKFSRDVTWNEFTNEKTIKEMLSDMVAVIGGNLYVYSQSPYIDTFYPFIIISAGENMASLKNRLLTMVPDVIRWFGNDAYIVYPQTTDKPSWTFKLA